MTVGTLPLRRIGGLFDLRLGLRTRVLLRWVARERMRDSDVALILLAALLGAGIGLGVVGLQKLLSAMHWLLFGTPFAGHISAGEYGEPWRLLAVPILGGLLYGAAAAWLRRRRDRDVVDPIEANALHGGRMSLTDSLGLTLMTLVSVGVGGSVGMEAAYTQSGSGLASKIGRVFRLRRADLRMLVGCGAAAAIAAAFNAPLAGAFYAFELIIGAYELNALAPVAAAALVATLVSRELFGGEPIFSVPAAATLSSMDYVAFAAVGLLSALIGITAMRGVSFVEAALRRLNVPRGLRPALGGLVLAGIAVSYPQVLGSGHGAIQLTVSEVYPLPVLGGLLLAKLAGSAVSVGSGFRGGMFSSSLFLGSLLGALIGSVFALLWPAMAPTIVPFALVGMGATGAAVIGAPVTMVLLVLEMTGNFPVTLGVMLAVLVASVVVRQTFGYSFSTWRFHLRGVRLRGAHDVGWVRDMTVGRLMRRDPTLVAADAPLGELRRRYPLGSAKRLFVTDRRGALVGVIDSAALHGGAAGQDDAMPAGALAQPQQPLLPGLSVRAALERFEEQEVEALAVIDGPESRRVLGYLTEAYAQRRYRHALEEQRRDELGDSDVFGPPAAAR